MKWKAATVALFMGAVLMGARPAQATAIDFVFNVNFGSTPTTGTLLGRLSDTPDDGDLLLTLIAAFGPDGASVDNVYFNFTDTKNVLDLNVALFSDTSGGSYINTSLGSNLYRADGDGYFDMRLNFSTGANPPQFGPTDTIQFLISSSAGDLFLQDFIELSFPGPGNSPGPFFGAAHVQNIAPNGDSTWLGVGVRPTQFDEPPDDEPPTPVPEPASLLLLGSGLFAVVRKVRKRA